MEPSLLDYARFHGIASDFTAIDPLAHIEDACAFKPETTSNPFPQNTQSECDTEKRLHNARVALHERLRGEKLSVPKEGARFLTSVIRENQAKSVDVDWDGILPAWDHIQSAMLEPPIFRMECESDVALSKKPLRYDYHGTDLLGLQGSCETLGDGNPLAGLVLDGGGSLLGKVRMEKLRCPRESFSMIQSIANADESPVKEIEELLRGLQKTTHLDTMETDTPVLRPLSENNFSSPSPRPVPEENMLPSPISSDVMDLDVHCTQPAAAESRQRGFMSNAIQARASSFCSADGECQRQSMELKSLRQENPRIATSMVDLDACALTTSLSDDGYDGEPLVAETRSGRIEHSVQQTLNASREANRCLESTTVSSSGRAQADPEVPTSWNDYLPLLKGTRIAAEQRLVPTESQQQCFGPVSETESVEKLSHSVSYNAQCLSSPHLDSLSKNATTISKRCPQQKRKRDRYQEPSQNSDNPPKGTNALGSNHERCEVRLTRASLGSLSSFMETRGRGIIGRLVPEESPYFPGSKGNENSRRQNGTTNVCTPKHQDQVIPDLHAAKPRYTNLSFTSQVPQVPAQNDGLVLFISTSLLKTHLRLLRCLEGAPHPPKVVYRDYTNNLNTSRCQTRRQAMVPTSQQTLLTPPPEEADIILSPKTGIMLTTSQATMQLYLPGHRPTQKGPQPDSSILKHINSPLRERIFRLSTRYEQLYIFISHVPEQCRGSKSSSPQLTANQPILTSLASLTAFCTSMSEHAHVTPLLLPSTPETTASNWILALAHKHACQLPTSTPALGFQASYSSGFTPVNPKRNLASSLGNTEESTWEVFLRRAGLNPYAAQVVLATLGREEEGGQSLDEGGSSEHGSQTRSGRLSRFVEMPSDERRVLFGALLGEKVLVRVDALIERDWQCDWALNFEGMV